MERTTLPNKRALERESKVTKSESQPKTDDETKDIQELLDKDEEKEAEESESPTESVLTDLEAELQAATKLLRSDMVTNSKTMYPLVLQETRNLAHAATVELRKYSGVFERVSELTAAARKDGDKTPGFCLVPHVLTGIMGLLVTKGRRPHSSCPDCSCVPLVGGINVDGQRSKSALAVADAAKALEPLPIKVMLVVSSDLKIGTTPFTAPKRTGGGSGSGRGGGARSELPDIGTILRGKYDKLWRYAEIVEGDEGQKLVRVAESGKTYSSLSKAVQTEYTHTSGPRWFVQTEDEIPEGGTEPIAA